MSESDMEENFTFGDFSLEDTNEFKRSYATSTDNAASDRKRPPVAASTDAGIPDTAAAAAAADIRHPTPVSPLAAPPTTLPTSVDLALQESASRHKESRPVEAAGNAASAAAVGLPQAPAPAKPSPPQPMSWARIAAGGAKVVPPSPPVRTAPNPGAERPIQNGTATLDRTATSSGGSSSGNTSGDRRHQDATVRAAGSENSEGALSSQGVSPSGDTGDAAQDEEKRDPDTGGAGAISADENPDAISGDEPPVVDVVVDTAAEDAARALAEEEAKAKAAEEAELLAGKRWEALMGMLGREDGLVVGREASVLMGAGSTVGDLVHRGLVNTGNSCFRSAVLQALLACEPFVGVLFRAAPALRDCSPAQEALPTWAQLARFAAAFEPPKPGVATPLGGGSGKGGEWSTAVSKSRTGRRMRGPGAPEPVLPDEAMSRAFGAFRSANTGEQEDAQEFLAFFLDQLHEEIVQVKKSQSSLEGGDGSSTGTSSPHGSGSGVGERTQEEEEDAWLEVGKGGTKAVVNTPDPRRRVSNSSVVTGLFYGMFRSEVRKSGNAKSSVTLEPFHCLQIDLDPPIQQHNTNSNNNTNNNNNYGAGEGASSGPAWGTGHGFEMAKGGRGSGRGSEGRGPKRGVGAPQGDAWSSGGGGGAWGAGGGGASAGAGATVLDEALAALFGGEAVAGVKGRRNVEVKASRTLTLEQAPKVLTLHLKQFSFHPELGPRKLARRVKYPLELTIPTKIMSPSLQHQASTKGPLKYRLFTVVLHHGRSLHGGHYTALIRDPRGEWRHCDDQHVTPEAEGHALNPMSGHPYLLLYTRM